ncbi:putative hydrolase of the HAD superfamily [Spinactinospora alkalitolerans]|uniref:Putative hydrolase of the HAD superfamily n=1 Tax=Spinactinospora alkalitolerans TaxID=687207 RepID=A0A852U023_9ACTN|nr:HAD-IA family hydrolase [Spinactinospora alkalitolerans]NYE50176.1 putative hydrolase of the HAD superfamily [Spinactinospora alkalitolerans]
MTRATAAPTWLLFDYVGVLTEDPHASDSAALAAASGAVTEAEFWDAYWADRRDYDIDALDGTGYWRAVTGRLGRPCDEARAAELVRLDIAARTHWRPGVLELVDALAASRGHRIAMLSNLPRDLASALRESPLADRFDPMLFSCDLGLVKPDAASFGAALARMDADPGDVVFIDDRVENTDAAEELGIRSIAFTDDQTLRRDLHALLG